MKRLVIAACIALGALTAKAKDIKTMKVTPTPKMNCENCENKIKKNLRYEKGVKDIVTDLKAQTITVTYDADKTSEAKLTDALGKIGYTVSAANGGQKDCCKDKKPTAKKGSKKKAAAKVDGTTGATAVNK